MTRLRYWLIWIADQVDLYILGHRWYRVCDRIANSSWWGERGGQGR